MKIELLIEQLKAIRKKDRSSLSEDDLKLLNEVIERLELLSSIDDHSIRKTQMEICFRDILKFFSVLNLFKTLKEVFEHVID